MLGVSDEEVARTIQTLQDQGYCTEAEVLRRAWSEHQMMAYKLKGMSNLKPWARSGRRDVQT